MAMSGLMSPKVPMLERRMRTRVLAPGIAFLRVIQWPGWAAVLIPEMAGERIGG
jgi:hypothetical protein